MGEYRENAVTWVQVWVREEVSFSSYPQGCMNAAVGCVPLLYRYGGAQLLHFCGVCSTPTLLWGKLDSYTVVGYAWLLSMIFFSSIEFIDLQRHKYQLPYLIWSREVYLHLLFVENRKQETHFEKAQNFLECVHCFQFWHAYSWSGKWCVSFYTWWFS